MTIETRPAGRTAVRLTTLGLGTATLGGNVRPPITNADAAAIVERAYERGIRFFDTAPYYGYGRSERLAGDTLRGRSGWVLSTKAGRLLRPRTEPQEASTACSGSASTISTSCCCTTSAATRMAPRRMPSCSRSPWRAATRRSTSCAPPAP